MDSFNPVMYSMNRKQEILNTEAEKPSRKVPKKYAALLVSTEADDGFVDLKVIPPEGEDMYDGISFAGMSTPHIAAVQALDLLVKFLREVEQADSFPELQDETSLMEDPQFISLDDLKEEY